MAHLVDGLPIKNGDFNHGYVSHNQMVGFFSQRNLVLSRNYVERCFLNIIHIEWTSPAKDVFFGVDQKLAMMGEDLTVLGLAL